MLSYLVLLLSAALGQAIQTTTGFGFAIVLMAIATSFFEVPILASASPMVSVLSSAYLTFRYRKSLKMRYILWPLAAFIAGNFAAVRLNRVLNAGILKGYLGIVLVLMSIFFLYFREKIHIRANVKNGLAAGVLSGILAGFFATGGPPISIYLVSSTEKKEEYLSAIQTYFLCSNLINITFRAVSGLITASVFRLFAVAAVGMLLGLFIGRKIVDRINIALLRIITYIFIGISGIWLIVSAFVLP